MSESLALILVDSAGLSVSATDAARALIDDALSTGALIGHVRDATDNEVAVAAQLAIKAVQKQIEAAYRGAKDPLVKLGRQLDQTYKGLVEDLEREYGRIGQLAAGFALAEQRRLAAEAALAREAMAKLEAEKHAAIAATSDPVAQSNILESFSRRAAFETPVPSAPTRATGQKVREEWEIKVVDLILFARWALYNAPQCADISVKLTPLKELLNGGLACPPGLECKRVAKSGVTLPREKRPIDV
jgi:hypothetical protein